VSSSHGSIRLVCGSCSYFRLQKVVYSPHPSLSTLEECCLLLSAFLYGYIKGLQNFFCFSPNSLQNFYKIYEIFFQENKNFCKNFQEDEDFRENKNYHESFCENKNYHESFCGNKNYHENFRENKNFHEN